MTPKRPAKPRKPKAVKACKQKSWRAFGILNRYGEPWTPRSFDTEELARKYLLDYQHNYPCPLDISRHRIVPVHVTITPVRVTITPISQKRRKK